MHDLAISLIRSFAVGLGKNKNYFDPWFKDESTAVFRGLHYLPRPSSVILDNPDHQKLVAPEHTDSGFITLLTTFMYPGLQVLLEGEYRSVKSKKNAIVINIGATL
jgi:isopenicillin N synthase-like dioxygenase